MKFCLLRHDETTLRAIGLVARFQQNHFGTLADEIARMALSTLSARCGRTVFDPILDVQDSSVTHQKRTSKQLKQELQPGGDSGGLR
jgi:hypothetical protein